MPQELEIATETSPLVAIPELPRPVCPLGWNPITRGVHENMWVFQSNVRNTVQIVQDVALVGKHVRLVDLVSFGFWAEPEDILFAIATCARQCSRRYDVAPGKAEPFSEWRFRLIFCPHEPKANDVLEEGTSTSSILANLHRPHPQRYRDGRKVQLVWGPVPQGWTRTRTHTQGVMFERGGLRAMVTEERKPRRVERQISVSKSEFAPTDVEVEQTVRDFCGPEAKVTSSAAGFPTANARALPMRYTHVSIPPGYDYEATIPATFERGWPRFVETFKRDIKALSVAALAAAASA